MIQPIRLQEGGEYGLHSRTIFGLDIFSVNEVELNNLDDPRIAFLRAICGQEHSSAHTGNLFDMADLPEELFGRADENNYYTTSIGVYGGLFYDVNSWPNFPACFFKAVDEKFWEIGKNRNKSVLNILSVAAIAFYIGNKNDTGVKVADFFSKPFVSHEKTVKDLADIFSMIILCGHDGDYFIAYSNQEDRFEALSSAISTAVKNIEGNTWYISNLPYLVWDDFEMCLVKKVST